MATSPEYKAYVMELVERFHPLRTRNMFGGVRIFSVESENMLAMITSEDVLYFKVDDENREDYEAAGMGQFHKMPYFQVPADVLEDDEQLRVWLLKSVDVAARTPKKKKKKKK